jgi:hypothetical protein
MPLAELDKHGLLMVNTIIHLLIFLLWILVGTY